MSTEITTTETASAWRPSLEDAVERLRAARAAEAQLGDAYLELLKAEAIAEAEQAWNAATRQCLALEEEVRVLAVREFETTGAKQLHGGVGIREVTDAQYAGSRSVVLAEQAIPWAERVAPSLISTSIDGRGLERVIKAMPEADRPAWITFTTKVIATLPKELTV